jgi:hypothetical protein
MMVETEVTSETSVNFYQTTRRYNPGNSHPHTISNFRSDKTAHKTLCYTVNAMLWICDYA